MLLSKKWIVSGLAGLAMLFTGCVLGGGDDATVDITNFALSTTSVNLAGATVNVQVLGDVSANEPITGIQIVVTDANGNDVTGFGINVSQNGVTQGVDDWDLASDGNVTIAVTAMAASGTYTVTVTASTATASTTKSAMLTVTGGAAGLTELTNGIVSNVSGPDQGGFDIVAGGRVTGLPGGAAMQDILDQSVAGAGLSNSWGSGNGTMFVKATATFNYATATAASVTAAYNAGTAMAVVTGLAAGDVYLLRLRGGNSYAAVSITNINPNAGGGNNRGEYYFNYKR